MSGRPGAYHQANKTSHAARKYSEAQLEEMAKAYHASRNKEETAAGFGLSLSRMRNLLDERGYIEIGGKSLRVPEFTGWDFSGDNLA